MAKKKTAMKKGFLPNSPVVAGIIIILGLIIYSGIFDNTLHFDDTFWSKHPAIVKQDYGEIVKINPLRMLTFLSLAVQWDKGTIADGELSKFYLFNLIVHLINSILVYYLLLNFFKTPALSGKFNQDYIRYLALFAALIFLTHPVMTQAVAYIYQRLASMAALFYILSINFYIAGRNSEGRNRTILLIISFVSMFAGILTKQNTFTIPLMMLAIEFFFYNEGLSGKRRNLLLIIAGVFTAGIAAVIITSPDFLFNEVKFHTGERIGGYTYFLTQIRVVADYIRILFVPTGLNLDYDYTLTYNLSDWRIWATFPIHLLMFFLVFRLFKHDRLISFGILWYYLTLSVESSVVPIADVINDHRLYLPMPGFAFIIIGIIDRFYSKSSWEKLLAPLAVIVFIFSIMTFMREKVWQNEITLWSDVIEKSPNKHRGFLNRGQAFVMEGKYAEALSDLDRAVELNPDITMAYQNRGGANFALKNYYDALHDFNKYIEMTKGSPLAYMSRANVYMALGDYKSAITDYNKYIQNRGGDNNTMLNRAKARFRIGEHELGWSDLQRTFKLGTEGFNAMKGVADELFNDTFFDAAIFMYNKLIDLAPEVADLYNNKATALFYKEKYERAVELYDKALELKPGYEKALINKGLALNKLGKFEAAIETYNKILEKKPGYPLAVFYRSQTFSDQGKRDTAMMELTALAKVYPDFKEAAQMLDSLKRND